MDLNELIALAANPHTELSTLQQLAQNYPATRPYIAANPATYPALLQWLGNLNDPAINAALQARGNASTAPAQAPATTPASAAAGTPATASEPVAESEPAATDSTDSTPAAQTDAAASTDADATTVYPAFTPTAATAAPTQPSAGIPQRTSVMPPQAATPTATVATPNAAANPAGTAWSGTGQTVFGVGTPDEDSDAEHRSNIWKWILGGIVVIVAIALIVWFAFGSSHKTATNDAAGTVTTTAAQTANPQPSQNETAAATATSTPSAHATSATPSPTPSASASTQLALKSPAPADAVEMSAFTSPSGNITCTLGDSSVSCTINVHEFVGTDASCSASPQAPFTVSVSAQGSASGNCSQGFAAAGATLNYGASAKNSTFACSSGEYGVYCWSQVSGKGFTISRENVQVQEG